MHTGMKVCRFCPKHSHGHVLVLGAITMRIQVLRPPLDKVSGVRCGDRELKAGPADAPGQLGGAAHHQVHDSAAVTAAACLRKRAIQLFSSAQELASYYQAASTASISGKPTQP